VNVTNVPSDLDWKDLKSAFSVVGGVELCITLDGMTQITFSTAESALKAVETYHNGKLNGQRIAVKLNGPSHCDTAGIPRGRMKTILATKLPSGLHWRNLKSAFGLAGRVDLCQVKDGMAAITFRSSAAAQKAVATYHGVDINGKRITVRMFDASNGVVLVSDEDARRDEENVDIDEGDSSVSSTPPSARLGSDVEYI
jgi:RNA recognition motif-containing protein